MKLYKGTWTGTDLVQPGRQHPEVDGWCKVLPRHSPEPGSPNTFVGFKTFSVQFEAGVADVDDAIGCYMIEQGLATAEPPAETVAIEAPAPAEPAASAPFSEYDDIPESDQMRIHTLGGNPNATIFVTPGRDCPDVPGWSEVRQDVDSLAGGDIVIRRRCKQFTVRFENGVATVDQLLGRYMVRKGLAGAWPLATLGALFDSRFNSCDAPSSNQSI